MKIPAVLSALVAGFFVSAVPVVYGQTIQNPSFEGQTYTVWPGYALGGNGGIITGWTWSGNAGLNPAGGNPFADNGAVPDGQNVAFLQTAPGLISSLSTTISGLVPGAEYRVSFRCNVRADYAPPIATCSVDGTNIVAPLPSTQVGAVGSTNPYHTVTGTFSAAGGTATLQVASASTGDAALLVDAFTIVRINYVTGNANAGAGSLRQALADAALHAGPDTIRFDAALAGQTISLGSTITINDAGGVTLEATGLPGGITIDDGTATTYGLFVVNSGSNVTFRGLTLANGGGANSPAGGGAVTNGGTLTLERCTLSGNSSAGTSGIGGAIANGGPLTLTHCTLTGNSATGTAGRGGAIHNIGTLALTHCTLSGNSATNTGGGIHNISGGTLTLTNCIVAGNNAATVGTENISGPFTGSNNLTTGDPKLAALANNGGPTKTMALLPGSQAIDAGAVVAGLDTDQRGFPRNRDGNATGGAQPDIGAYEAQAPPVLGTVHVAVTTAADENDANGTPGTGLSLREALRDAPDGAVIVFDAALAGQFITLSAVRGDLILDKNATIDARSLAGGVTITRDVTGVFRLFTVLSGKTVALAGLTLSGGRGGGQNLTTTGGAIQNAGTLSLTNCTLSANAASFNGGTNTGTGGAIHNDGTLTVTGCTFVNNATLRTGAGVSAPILDDSAQGGAIYNPAGKSLTVTNCTFTANNSISDGGAIASLGTLTITHGTFLGNFIGGNGLGGYGGAISLRGGTLSLAWSIVAGNMAAPNNSNGPDFYRHVPGAATITAVGKNLIGNLAASGLSASPTILTGPANLAAPGNYGGPTQTMPPLPGSLAIDAASGSTTATDQRGNVRPLDGDGNGSAVADLGAVERASPVPLRVTTTANSGAGSLRQAITNATGEPGETVTFQAGFTGPIVLASEITVPAGKTATVDAGSGTGGLLLAGSGTSRIFSVAGGGSLTLKGVTLTGGKGANLVTNGTGGAIYNLGTMTLTHCTLSGNSTISGGAIYNLGTMTLMHCTLSDNSAAITGGAIYSGGALTLTNTIVTGNTAPNGPDIHREGGAITPTGRNLIGNLNSSSLSAGGSVLTGALNLSPLGDYGGSAPTMVPLPGSPAINPAGGDTTSSFTTDQRGSARVAGGIVDIGAVEAVVVANLNGSGAGSLRQAVNDASNGSIINFVPTLNGGAINLALANGTIVLNKTLEINARSLAAGITVNGGSQNFRLFSVSGGRTVTMHNLKLTNGGGPALDGYGGAILNGGTLALTRCTLSGNKVKTGNSGGAIDTNTGSTLALTDCTLTGNEASFGGAISTGGGVVLDRCTLSQNKALAGNGGAVSASGTTANVVLTQCTVAGNTATGAGGGIGMFDGILTLNQCTIAGNSVNSANAYGGGVFVQGGFAIANTIIASNTATTGGPDLFEGTSTSFAFTGRVFIGNLNGNGFTADAEVLTGNAMLSPLSDYGGPTQTMVPLAGSPVRDKAGAIVHEGAAMNVTFPTDQRSTRRTLDSDTVAGAVSDLGAAESGKDTAQDYYLWSQSTALPAGATAAQRAAGADYDNDGQSNYSEWLALTNPANSSNRFVVHGTTDIGSNLLFTFTAAAGRIYRLRQQIGGNSAIYYPIAPITGNGSQQIFTVPRSAGSGIFDVEVSLP